MRTLLLRCEDCQVQFEVDNTADAFEAGEFLPVDEADLVHQDHDLSSYWGGPVAELHEILREQRYEDSLEDW